MLRRTFIINAAAAGLSLGAPRLGRAETAPRLALAPETTPTTGPAPATGYVSVNGLKLYYESHGSGEPLVLLHGGLGTIGMLFGQLLPVLARTRQVIAVELQAHGHTADIDRPLSYEAMADDIAALIRQLGLDTADLFGFSLGGGVALQAAIRHPEVVRKLVVASTPYRRDGWFPEVLAGMAALTWDKAAAMTGSLMHQFYVEVAPKPEDWPVLVAKTGQLLARDYDWSAAVAAITAPVLILVGDCDLVRTEHAVEMFRLLGGGAGGGLGGGSAAGLGGLSHSRLAVLPDTTHFSMLTCGDLVAAITQPFLDAPMAL
ncbi:alpha/beta fold hydrolase [Phreatobacter stygius]|uniref:Alpha/beta hydrolase n=1 Tax=Phreatobacter stygius TaxID=1940610 RepID=A0A4D7AZ34_9HYPH|nr:alpha/beta hydrolase [Phreatobacter stygius]QCI62960.1 alpha/beta hydrolase [Phreatobacter stygius]